MPLPTPFPLLLAACLSLAAWDMAQAVEIIVNPRTPITEISRAHARSIFGARVTRWQDSTPIRVFVLADDTPLHQEMTKTLLDLYPYQLRNAWERIIYTGIGQAPIEVASEADMRRRVGSTPGAIGYISKVSSNDSVRALPLR